MEGKSLTHRHLTRHVNTGGRDVCMGPGMGSNLMSLVKGTLHNRCKLWVCNQVVIQAVDKECDLDFLDCKVVEELVCPDAGTVIKRHRK